MKKILLIYLFIFIVISIFSQTLDPPVANTIISDYGPRQLSKYDWHGGIDYASPQWTAVEAVEGGDITEINYWKGTHNGGYIIRISEKSGSRVWTYMHLFNDDANPQYGNWEVRMATLENPDNPEEIYNRYIFILWNNKDNNIAEKVLAPYFSDYRDGLYIQSRSTDPGYNPDNPYILDINGDPILTQGSVEEGEVIGLSGNSGGVGAHLHVSCSDDVDYNYNINPLYHIKHTTPSYTFNILKPLDKEILYHIPNVDSTKQIYERVKVYINSSTGRDLDKVKLYLFDKEEEHKFDESHLLKKIIYGGLSTGEESSPYPSYIAKDGDDNKGSYNKTGIAPKKTELCGLDTIYFINLQTDINTEGSRAKLNKYAKYKDGLKDMVIRAHSINSKIFTSEERELILDNFTPYISNIAIYQNFEQQYVAGYYTTETSIEEIEIEKDEGIDPEGVFNIEINFSEDMDINKKPEVYVSNGTERCNETNGLWKNNRQYASTFSSVDIGGEELRIEVSNAYDIGGNLIDINPRTIAYRNENGTWNNYETGIDNNFVFKVKGYPPIVQGIVVRVDEHIYYTDGWSYDELVKILDNAVPLDFGDIEIDIMFSKKMDTGSAVHFLINKQGEILELGGVAPLMSGWDEENSKIYKVKYGGFSTYQLEGLFEEGEQEITIQARISGGYDKSGMEIDIDPSTVAYEENGTWYDYEKMGEDTSHIFRLRKGSMNLCFEPDYGTIYKEESQWQRLLLAVKEESIEEENNVIINLNMSKNSSGYWDINPSISSFNGEKEMTENYEIEAFGMERVYKISEYLVTNTDAEDKDKITINAIVNRKDGVYTDERISVETYFISDNPEKEENHPDDAQLIAEGNYPTNRIYNPWSNIGVLLSGAGVGISHIMGKFNTGICGVIPENFKVSGISGRQLEDLDVLIIGSAGIYVLNNPVLRERLRKWVENGGTVISMTSQFGFEWEYLPIPDGEELRGYGWDEDQYCSRNSVYIEDRHPIISGQTRKIPSMYVDGYIEKYPSNAKIPLKRTASTMPAAIEYRYGNGNVIITSNYVDWGYNHSQYFDDLIFVRDMIKYGEIAGKYIEEITDYSVNQTEVDIEIKNRTSRIADRCIIKIFSPDNIIQDSIIIDSMNLIGGESYGCSAVIDCEQRGIYTIKYKLFNADNNIIQNENIYGGIVKYDALEGGDYAENGLKMWCTSDKDKCMVGDSVTVTTHLLNLQDDPFTGKIMIAIHERTRRSVV